MRINFLSLLGIAFFLLAIWRGIHVRRDLARSETQWERAIFGRRAPISRWDAPTKFWCAIAVNTTIVLLFTLVGVGAFRVVALSR